MLSVVCFVYERHKRLVRTKAFVVQTFLQRCHDAICSGELMLVMLCSHIEAFTLQDMHSLMLMMCSDVPLRVTRSAFKAATPLLPSGDFLKVILSCVVTV